MNTPSAAIVNAFSNSVAAWLAEAPTMSAAAREFLRTTARLILTITEAPVAQILTESETDNCQSRHADDATGSETVSLAPPFVPTPSAEPPLDDAQRQLLTNGFGNGSVSPKVFATTPTRQPLSSPDTARPSRVQLSLISTRAEVASRGCEWAANRNEILDAGQSFEVVRPGYDALRAECDALQPLYLWMLQRETAHLSSDQWTVLQGCYMNVSLAAEVVNAAAEGIAAEADLVRIFAEAQSALLGALESVDQHDRIQSDSFQWCRAEAAKRQIFIDHLLLDEPADPGLWRGLRARIEAARDKAGELRSRERSLKKSLNTINYHVKQIIADRDADHANDWKRIDEALQAFIDADGQPSNAGLIESIEPVADHIPEELVARSSGIRRVLPFIDQRAASQEPTTDDPTRDRAVTPDLRRARDLLRGKRVVMIGGEARRPQRDTLERELELKELVWISSREHQSIESFLPDVARADTALVIVAIRWSSHSFEDVKLTCDKHGKPYVRLPAGYGVNRVAFEIVRQQGDELGRSDS